MRALALLPLLLTACVTADGRPVSADLYRTHADAKRLVLANKIQIYRDPDSLRDASIGAPIPGGLGGVSICVESNGRNGFGGMTGLGTNVIYINSNGDFAWARRHDGFTQCGPMIPFPELSGTALPKS